MIRHAILVLCAATISFCSKNKTEEITYVPIEKFLYGLLYEQGSYWIYRDSLSGVTDSSYISSAIEKNIIAGGGQGISGNRYQAYCMLFENFIHGKSRKLDAAKYAIYNEFTPPSDYNWFFYPFEKPANQTIGHIRPLGHQKEFTTGPLTFRKVYIIDHDSVADRNSGTFERIFVSDSFGLVQYTLYRNYKIYKQCKLVRQHLIRHVL